MIVAIVVAGIAALAFLLGTALRSQSEALRLPSRGFARPDVLYPAQMGVIRFTLAPNLDGMPVLRAMRTATEGGAFAYRVSPELQVTSDIALLLEVHGRGPARIRRADIRESARTQAGA